LLLLTLQFVLQVERELGIGRDDGDPCIADTPEPRKMLPATNPPIISGIITVVIKKPRVRTRSEYSRCAISHTLRIEMAPILGILVAPGRLCRAVSREVDQLQRSFPHLFNEYLFQRGLGHRKTGDVRV
jgi:hypothetical protein